MGFLAPKSRSTTPTRLNGISINQSSYGNCIPLLYGTDRVAGTVVDYLDFKAIPVSQSGGGKGGGHTTSSYNYTASIILSICEGPIGGVLAVMNGQSVTTLGAQSLTLFTGAGSQAPWAYSVQLHPDHALGYDHTAYAAGANYALGSNAGLPNLSFETAGLALWQGGPDAHPADILPDYCTEPNHGVSFPYLASLEGPNSFRSYCTAMLFLISPCETTQRAAHDFIQEILQITNSNTVWSPGVGLRFVPYADQAVSGRDGSYIPNLAPEFTFVDADFTPDRGGAPIITSIVPGNTTFNCWRVEFLERSNQYNTAIAEYRDELDIAMNGLRVAQTVTLHSIKVRAVAVLVATLLCNRNLYIRTTFTFKVRGDFCLLEPMDLVALNDSSQGIVDQLVRITDIEDDANDQLTITAEEMVVGPASAPIYNTQLAQAFAQNYLVDPGPVAPPYIFTFPPKLADPQSGGYEIGVAVGGTTGFFGGADIWASMDNVTYWHVGAIDATSRMGVVASPLAAGNDPDTANTLTVQLNPTTPMTMLSGTRADADNLLTPCIVDGEIIAYQVAQALGNNAFALSYLRRGKYGSTSATHAAGSQFAIIDQNIFRMKFDPGYAGLPVWFKFVAFNYFGGTPQTLGSVVAYQAFFQAQNAGVLDTPGAVPLIARNKAVCTGNQIYKMSNGASAWDSDCYSVVAFSGGCTARATARTPGLDVMFGLNQDPLTDASYTSLDYAWWLAGDRNAYMYENGVNVGFTRAYVNGTVAEIRYDGQFITYLLDNVIWRTVPAPARSLHFDSSFYAPNALLDNVYFGLLNPATPSPFKARGQCVVSHENAQKVGGVDGWDSDIYSLEGYPQCHVLWKPNVAAGADLMVGLGTKPAQDSSYTSIDFAWHQSSAGGGTWFIYESGALILNVAAVSVTDAVAITYDGATVTYLLNAVVRRTVAAPGRLLFLDSSFYQPGCGCNTLQFGPTPNLQLADTSQIGAHAATDVLSTTLAGPFGTASATPTNVVVVSLSLTAVTDGVFTSLATFSAGYINGGLTELSTNDMWLEVISTSGGTQIVLGGDFTQIANSYALQIVTNMVRGDVATIKLWYKQRSNSTRPTLCISVKNIALRTEIIKR